MARCKARKTRQNEPYARFSVARAVMLGEAVACAHGLLAFRVRFADRLQCNHQQHLGSV